MSTLIVIIGTVLAIIGAPLFVIMAIAGLSGFYLSYGVESTVIVMQEFIKVAQNPGLTALPLFTLAGFLMAESKTPERLVEVAQSLFGWLPGGLAIVSLSVCAVFTALTGASGVTIIALGGLLLPALIKENYPEQFSLGLLTSSGSLGLLFPPSLPLIIFGLVATVSIDKLFVAGLVPGIFLVFVLSIYSTIVGVRANVPRHKFELERILKAIYGARWELPIPVIILGGIFGGFVSPSQAASVTAMYVLIVEVFLYRDIKIKELPKIGVESMAMIGAIIFILGVAMGFTNFLVDLQVPQQALGWIQQFVHSKMGFLIMLNIFLLIVGCLMDIFSAIIVVVPLILPLANSYGVDPIHLGIIFLTNLEIGYSTPPVGMNLFLASFRFQRPITELYKAVIPWLLVLLGALMVITYVPALSLWSIDSDNDGLTYLEEYSYGTDPFEADADKDWLKDGEEKELGTDPYKKDTDEDGLTDKREANIGTNPLAADTDGDGLTDAEEVKEYDTDPKLADTDGDGIDDATAVRMAAAATSDVTAPTDAQ